MSEELNLNNKRMKEQALKTHSSEVEVLYWILEDSLYDNQEKKAKSIFNMLLYVGKYRKDLIAQHLHQRQRERLQEISHEIYGTNGTYKKREPVTIRTAISPKQLPFKNEGDLENHLASNPDILSAALRDQVEIVGTQVETDCDYKCDIVAKSQQIFYPIELKIGQANHQVVSQCNKYCFYFYRTLRYDRYKDIQGIVCGNGFDDWSINELRREGIWIFDIIPKKKTVSLQKID